MAIQSKADAPMNAVQWLESYRKQLEQALPKNITVDRMIRLVSGQMRSNPELGKASPASLIGAVFQCCLIGLEPGNGKNHIHLVPFKGVVKPIIGYEGMIDLVMDTRKVKSISADVVYNHDYFSYEMTFEGNRPQKPVHKHNVDAERSTLPKDIKLAYAVAVLSDDVWKFEYLSTKEITNKHQKETTPWKEHWSEMAKKTAIRRIYKTLPKSALLSEALEREEDDEFDYARLVKDLVPQLASKIQEGTVLDLKDKLHAEMGVTLEA